MSWPMSYEGPPPGNDWLRNVDVWNDARNAGAVDTWQELVDAVTSGELPAHPAGVIGLWFRESEVQAWIANRLRTAAKDTGGIPSA